MMRSFVGQEKQKEWLTPLIKISKTENISIHKPYHELNESQKEIIWYGKGEYKGIFAFFKELEEKSYKIQNRILLARYRGKQIAQLVEEDDFVQKHFMYK